VLRWTIHLVLINYSHLESNCIMRIKLLMLMIMEID